MIDEDSRRGLEIKKANIRHHDVEAIIFENAHPEGSSIYEASKVKDNLETIVNENHEREVCIDVGCGTGFVTSFELPLYDHVIALDISSNMIKTARNKFSSSDCLDILQGDAEYLPFKQEVADLVSISSVLHHVPRPFHVISDSSRILKKGGIIYITREPNLKKTRRYFAFIDQQIIQKITLYVNKKNTRIYTENDQPTEGLDYDAADIHFPIGLKLKEITAHLRSNKYEILNAYSYHWIFSDYKLKSTRDFTSKINFLIENIPFTDKIGRYINIVAQKMDANI